MRTARTPGSVLLALLALACGEPPTAPTAAAPGGTFAIVGVDVLPMDRDVLLDGRTVLVEDGRIAAVGGAGKVEIPDGAARIDGRGLVLVPGLHDLHVHLEEPEELVFYLANGVTTVLNLSGSPEKLALRAALAAGERVGPRLLTCGPTLHGTRTDAGSVAGEIRTMAAAGYDCVKIYGDWEPAAYVVAADAAQESGLAFMGHAPRNLPFSVVLDDGRQQIVHLEEIVYTTPELDAWLERFRDGEVPGPEDDPRVALAEPIARVAEGLAERGIWVVPTEVVIDNYLERASDEGLARLAARPYLRYRDPIGRRRWARGGQHARRIRFDRQVALQHYMLEVFRERGVPMAAGTDAALDSSLSVMPGWSLHEELAILASTGFTPYEALRAATADAAAYLGESDGGVIAPGARADLLLLEGDPRADLSAAVRPLAVIVGGRWTPRTDLARRLEEIGASHAGLEDQLARIDPVLESGTPAEWIAALRRLEWPAEELAGLVESEINRRGYELLGDQRIDEAIAVFELNVESFPGSANVYDSLAEAWLERGDRERAIALYRRALEVDPEFGNAARILAELGVEP